MALAPVRVVLATDGIADLIPRPELVEVVRAAASPEVAVEQLHRLLVTRHAAAPLGSQGRRDDWTTIVRFSAVNQPLYQGNVTACAPSLSSCSCWSCTPPQVLVRRAPSALRFAMGGMGQAVMTYLCPCHDGLICPNVTSPCLGRYGAGCYNPAYGYVLQRSGVYDAFAAVSRTTWRTVL